MAELLPSEAFRVIQALHQDSDAGSNPHCAAQASIQEIHYQ
jgi:hypothetical protein